MSSPEEHLLAGFQCFKLLAAWSVVFDTAYWMILVAIVLKFEDLQTFPQFSLQTRLSIIKLIWKMKVKGTNSMFEYKTWFTKKETLKSFQYTSKKGKDLI